MFTIPASFIGDFKRGDNINYNLQVLKTLYDCNNTLEPEKQPYLRKPIFLTIMSIVEAVLYDFDSRIRHFTREGVQNLGTDILALIRGKQYDDLAKYIACAKRHGFFDTVHQQFYDDLEKLRKIRNRIHIQNDKNYLPRDENRAFTPNNIYLAECALEVVMRTMNKKYPRPNSVQGCVEDFSIPWEARYENIDGNNNV